jgi:hypothetical protein
VQANRVEVEMGLERQPEMEEEGKKSIQDKNAGAGMDRFDGPVTAAVKIKRVANHWGKRVTPRDVDQDGKAVKIAKTANVTGNREMVHL